MPVLGMRFVTTPMFKNTWAASRVVMPRMGSASRANQPQPLVRAATSASMPAAAAVSASR